jgi:hypothetical protein
MLVKHRGEVGERRKRELILCLRVGEIDDLLSTNQRQRRTCYAL